MPMIERIGIVKEAALGRGWFLESESEDSIVVRINHRGVEAKLVLSMTDSKLKYFCEGTRKTSTSRKNPNTGRVTKKEKISDFVPINWIKNIKASIEDRLPIS